MPNFVSLGLIRPDMYLPKKPICFLFSENPPKTAKNGKFTNPKNIGMNYAIR